MTSQESALPLHMQKVWGYDPAKIGLVSLAAVVPTVLCK
jgi:DHA1 family solute carrier family 18 vesicular amine transporter 1/2